MAPPATSRETQEVSLVTAPFQCGFIRDLSSQGDSLPLNTNVLWNRSCDFFGNDIASNQQISGVTNPSDCGNLCLNYGTGCNTFIWNANTNICSLKNTPGSNVASTTSSLLFTCGFIVDRFSSGSCDCNYQSSISCKVSVSTPAPPGQACHCIIQLMN